MAAAEDDEGPPLDVRRVVEALDRHHVEYMLVGGSAARLYGSEHLTKDVDLVPDSAVENLDRLAAALRDLEAFMRVGGLSDAEARSLPVVIDAMALGRMEISTWRTSAGDLDVLHHLRSEAGGRVDYSEMSQRSTRTDLGGLEVRLASLGDIVASKRFADREKDRAALPDLERLLREIDGS